MTETVLSAVSQSVWGKSSYTDTSGWLPLWTHLADAADVAGRLWDEWLSDAVRNRLAAGMPDGDADGRRLAQWLAGVHDIGKATPAFAIQSPHLAKQMRESGFSFDPRVPLDRRLAPHSIASHVLLGDFLVDRYQWDGLRAAQFAAIVGGHHGLPPVDIDLDCLRERRYLLGAERIWTDTQNELLTWMAARTGVDARLAAWRDVVLSQPVQVLLTAIVIVADWISSNEELFPYGNRMDAAVRAGSSARLEQAWRDLDMPSPWHIPPPPDDEELFRTRFELPTGATPYPIQRVVALEARQMPTPGMLIVEAPMGEGKTEAALVAAEILASRTGASGVALFLPTRATTDAMYGRLLHWLSRLPDLDVRRGARDIMLAHGKARFTNAFTSLYRTSVPSAIGIDEGGAEVGVHWWLAGRKRTLLSSFITGTIDQLLFSALKARHLVLRHLGLAGKVVIVDEAHAYDVYMNEYLDRALEWLGAHGVCVIILSATLPAQRRAELIAAYDDGRLGVARRSLRSRPIHDPYRDLRSDLRYPLVSISGESRDARTTDAPASSRSLSVSLEPLADDIELLADLLREQVADGGCALVVRNTVRRAEQTATELRQRLNVPVSLAHSRFMTYDRAAKDEWLRTAFGPPTSQGVRPERHIVVATQVAEQSLDIDFDLLVTDLAPIDLVLQRIGRLHRHPRAHRPERLASPRCLVTGVEWSTEPPEPVDGSIRVYGRHALLRAAAVLLPHTSGGHPVRIPDNIAPLVHTAYGDEAIGPASWQDAMAEARSRADEDRAKQRKRADTFRLHSVDKPGTALIGWLATGIGDADTGADDARGRAHVRSDSSETLEVILLVRHDGALQTPGWLPSHGGETVSPDFPPRADLARMISGCTLPLPRSLTSGRDADAVIVELEARNQMPGWQKDPWLSGELVLDIDQNGEAMLDRWLLRYDPHDGLRVTRITEDAHTME